MLLILPSAVFISSFIFNEKLSNINLDVNVDVNSKEIKSRCSFEKLLMSS